MLDCDITTEFSCETVASILSKSSSFGDADDGVAVDDEVTTIDMVLLLFGVIV